MYPDAGGVRDDRSTRWPTSWPDYGYAVLLPDVYYRHGDWEPFDMADRVRRPEQSASG